MKYGIAAFPSKEVQDAANSLRKRYDPHYSRIQPHLTLREAEEWNEEMLTAAVDHLEQVTLYMAPIQIEFNRFSTFYPTNNVIYMALQQPQDLMNVHEQLCSGPLSMTNSKYRFMPHLTVGQEMSNDELHDVLASLRKQPLNLVTILDRVHLLYQTENQAWTAYQTFLLRG